MIRIALAGLALLGTALAACADGPVAETVPAPGLGWPFAKKTAVAEGPLAPPVTETARGTKDPNSFVHATTEEFFARPIVFEQPAEPVKTTQWFWVSGEYLHWWTKEGPLPVPLVVVGTDPGLDPPPLLLPMILPAGDAGVVFGGDGLDYGAFDGARLGGGFWFGDDCDYEVNLSGFTLGQRSAQFFLMSAANGAPFIGRPFIDGATGNESVFVVSSPGAFQGAIGISSTSQLYGIEGNLSSLFMRSPELRWDVGVGVRYLALDEDLVTWQRLEELEGGQAFFDGVPFSRLAVLTIYDSFSTTNQFFGGQFETSASYQYGGLLVEGRAKLALGANRTQFNTLGISALRRASSSQLDTELGGFLAQESNIGEETRNNFSIASELGVDIGWCVSSYCILKVGYTFLYWTDVARPGTMIDPVVNSNQIPTSPTYQNDGGAARPLPRFNRSDFWAQGISLGVEFRY